MHFTYKPSLVRIDAHNFELSWYQTHKHTDRHGRLQYTVLQLNAQCNNLWSASSCWYSIVYCVGLCWTCCSGVRDGTMSQFETCYAAVQRVVRQYQFDRPPEIVRTTFYALSYYVDTAADVNLISQYLVIKLPILWRSVCCHKANMLLFVLKLSADTNPIPVLRL